MQVLKTIDEIKNKIGKLKTDGKSLGFIPTMGALHQGHLSLVKKAKVQNDIVIVSIFVNPIQFNNPEDLAKYPRTLEADATLLEAVGCDVIFAPTAEEMYPRDETPHDTFDFGLLDKVMEGPSRPGHFQGVAVVVLKLFKLIHPNKAYFGEKDFQQLAIIQELVRQRNLNIEIVACPIIREKDGLAMSSRNLLLNENERKAAPYIHAILSASKEQKNILSPIELKKWVENKMKENSLMELEYFELADTKNLQTICDWQKEAVGCIVVRVGKVRLIDNIRY